jgi:glycosyltransferase involved in cell wall biosynthesis
VNEQQPLRVLVIAPSLDHVGGQAMQAARLMEGLRSEASLDPSFLRSDPRVPGPLRWVDRIKYARTMMTSIAYVGTLVARVPKSDVVHVFAASSWSFLLRPTPAIVVCKLFRKKIVVNYHSGEAAEHLARWRTAVWALRHADTIVVQSAYLQEVFGRFNLRTTVIANHLDPELLPFRERRPLRPLFLSSRSLEPSYDVATVLRAFGLIQQRFPRARLVVVGDGSQRAELERLAEQLRLRRTTFAGTVDPLHMARVYDAAEVLLNASTVDSMPLSLLEAFACGLPIVTTAAGGIPCVVTHGETGLLVPPRDWRGLASAAMRLLDDEGLAAKLVSRARAACPAYTWPVARHGWLTLYRDLGASRSRRRQLPLARGSPSHRFANLRKVRKARGRSRDELRVRGAQALAACGERTRLSRRARMPTDRAFDKLLDPSRLGDRSASGEGLLEHFRLRSGPQISPAFEDRPQTVAEYRRRFGPTTGAALIDRADRAAEGRLDLLGHRDLPCGSPIDWHLDPITGRRAPLVHWSRLARPNPRSSGDRKLVWELNRHQFFVTLGRAYWLTGDERYAEAFARQLSGWIDQNPAGLGTNWASSLEVALRAISWTWALHLFLESPSLKTDLFLRAFKLLYLHARHVETYLSTYSSPNTHLTGEALGLFYLGTVWPELGAAARWKATGLGILLSSQERQVGADGVYFERSTWYHRYSADFYEHLLVLASANGCALDPVVRDRLGGMLDHLLYVARPDGTMPLLGDDDGGRLLPLDERPCDDLRSTLATGAALLGRPEYKAIAGEPSEETLWLAGPEGLLVYDRLDPCPPVNASCAFRDGGLYVMRDAWSRTSDVLTIDCGEHGALNGAHAHADALAFDLCAGGRPILVDPGTHSYARGGDLEDYFRSTAAHNTVTVDEESSSVPDGPFGWSRVAQCTLRAWYRHPRCDVFEGAHDGYHRLSDPVTHVRTVLFLKDGYWIIRDRLLAVGAHRYDIRFHFAPDAQPVLAEDQGNLVIRELPTDAPGLEIITFGPPGSWRLTTERVSRCYGALAPAPVAAFTAIVDGQQDFITFLLPRSPRQASATVWEADALGGRAFEIRDGDICDLLLTCDGGTVQAGSVVSDFAWTWARAGTRHSKLEEVVLVDGRNISIAGEHVVRAPHRTACAVGRTRGDHWALETIA